MHHPSFDIAPIHEKLHASYMINGLMNNSMFLYKSVIYSIGFNEIKLDKLIFISVNHDDVHDRDSVLQLHSRFLKLLKLRMRKRPKRQLLEICRCLNEVGEFCTTFTRCAHEIICDTNAVNTFHQTRPETVY